MPKRFVAQARHLYRDVVRLRARKHLGDAAERRRSIVRGVPARFVQRQRRGKAERTLLRNGEFHRWRGGGADGEQGLFRPSRTLGESTPGGQGGPPEAG